MEKEREFLDLMEKAERVYASDVSPERKYMYIFGDVVRKIRELGFMPDYYDPDTTYEEDLAAVMEALRPVAVDIKKLVEAVETKNLMEAVS